MFDMDTANVDDPELVEVDKKIKSKVSIVVKIYFIDILMLSFTIFCKVFCYRVLLISS